MKIMVWNIEKFTGSKFGAYGYTNNPKLNLPKTVKYDAINRLNYMKGVVVPKLDASETPDVIAVLEVMASKTTLMGQPLANAQAAGVTKFLKLIKNQTGNSDWRVVPPIKCNPPKPDDLSKGKGWAAQEAIAVFYNSKTVSFEGPDYWTSTGIQRASDASPPVAPTTVSYPKPWNDTNYTDNTRRAGRVYQTNDAGDEVLFPHEMNRRPFMTDFKEKGGKKRLFRCLFIHTSPNGGKKGSHTDGTRNIADISDMKRGNKTAKPNYFIACGDFNVNSYFTNQSSYGYETLKSASYKLALTKNNSNSKSTHLFRNKVAKPSGGSFCYAQRQLIDNFLIRKSTQKQNNMNFYQNKVAVDRIAGTSDLWDTAMAQSLATINAIPSGTSPGSIGTFHQWENFWNIIATSDHLPIYMEIP